MPSPAISLSRLTLMAALAAGGILPAGAGQAQTLKVVMQSGLRVTDPLVSTGYITRDHGYMIYDTLLGMDEHFQPRPQMADWTLSDDGRIYTFTLREGLKFHDGTPVTAEDAVASFNRWSEIDGTGQPLRTLIEEVAVRDARQFTITLKAPSGLLLSGMAKLSSRPLFVMPARLAATTPASEPVREHVGSGPFRMVEAEFEPGLRVVYEANPDYIPRDEPGSWTAGGKKVNVDRVEWIAMPDPVTAVNALTTGEVDFIQQVPYDLMPLLVDNADVEVKVLDQLGSWTYFRVNHLQPPFDRPALRRAAMLAVEQSDVLDALVGDAANYSTCAAILGCGTPNGFEAERDVVVHADIPAARAILAAEGYANEPVVVLHPTDNALVSSQPVVIAAALRKAGFNVEMKAMDWQTVVTSLRNQGPTSEGGWSVFATSSVIAASSDPFNNVNLSTAGAKSWVGWPDVPRIEALRLEFAAAADEAAQREIAEQIQRIAIAEGVVMPLGQFSIPAAFSREWEGFIEAPVTLFWNVAKAER